MTTAGELGRCGKALCLMKMSLIELGVLVHFLEMYICKVCFAR